MDITSYLLGKKSGGITPTGEVEITENGVHNVSGYATANVDVEPDLESKEVTITTNTTTNITPTQGKDGLSGVNVITNVQPNLETKSVTITENTTTTITPTSGKDGMSSVEVTTNVEGSPYMRATKAELDQINAKYGDYGIVYSYSQTYYQPSDGDITVYFPPVVVLPTAITQGYSCPLSLGTTASIAIDATSFTVKSSFFSYIVRYSSTDGITYTKYYGGDSSDIGSVTDASKFIDSMKYFLVKERQANFVNFYQYTDRWEPAYMGLTTLPLQVLAGSTFFSDNGSGGVQTGTLSGDNFQAFSTLKALINGFDTSNWTSGNYMFNNNDYKFLGLIQALDTSNFTSAVSMFSGFKMKPIGDTQIVDLTHFDMGKINSANNMFSNFGYDGTPSASDRLILKFNANFTVGSFLNNLFKDSKFDEIYVQNAYFGSVSAGYDSSTCMGCSNLKKFNISGSLYGLNSLQNWFKNCTNLEEVNFSISGSTPILSNGISNAFEGCSTIEEIDLSMFNLSSAAYVGNAFKGCTSLTKLDIRTFDIPSVASYTDMFTGVPNNCEIKVKSQTVKTWIENNFSNLTNIVIV